MQTELPEATPIKIRIVRETVVKKCELVLLALHDSETPERVPMPIFPPRDITVPSILVRLRKTRLNCEELIKSFLRSRGMTV
jgi:hypothetical protein